jgi:hypothetical protein
MTKIPAMAITASTMRENVFIEGSFEPLNFLAQRRFSCKAFNMQAREEVASPCTLR